MERKLPEGKKILAVFAHPDDEAFGPGGTLAVLTKRNEVWLICVTDGRAGGRETNLAKIRRDELKRATKVLGIQKTLFFDYEDGHLDNATYHQITSDIQKVVDEFKPQILLTFALNGISGHLDHVAVAMETSYVFRENNNIEVIWYFGEREDHLREALRFREDYFIYFPPGFNENEIDVVVDTSAVYETKLMAMREHASQIDDCERIIKARMNLPKEEYFRVVGRV